MRVLTCIYSIHHICTVRVCMLHSYSIYVRVQWQKRPRMITLCGDSLVSRASQRRDAEGLGRGVPSFPCFLVYS
jgi:hypothetical protein